jgi:hypothetical protein
VPARRYTVINNIDRVLENIVCFLHTTILLYIYGLRIGFDEIKEIYVSNRKLVYDKHIILFTTRVLSDKERITS